MTAAVFRVSSGDVWEVTNADGTALPEHTMISTLNVAEGWIEIYRFNPDGSFKVTPEGAPVTRRVYGGFAMRKMER